MSKLPGCPLLQLPPLLPLLLWCQWLPTLHQPIIDLLMHHRALGECAEKMGQAPGKVIPGCTGVLLVLAHPPEILTWAHLPEFLLAQA
jgi:hypothetical protein